MKVERVIRRTAVRFPSLATAAFVYRRLLKSERAFARAGREERGIRELVRVSSDGRLLELTPEELFDLRISVQPVVASQQLDEIVPALERIERLRPQRVCEIGTAAGGTLYLLTRVSAPDALVVSIDLVISPHTRALRERLARPGQRVVSWPGIPTARRRPSGWNGCSTDSRWTRCSSTATTPMKASAPTSSATGGSSGAEESSRCTR